MYLFKDFNQRHYRDLLISCAFHLSAVIVAFLGGYLLFQNPVSILNFTLVFLFVAHAIRIIFISRIPDLDLNRSQIVFLLIASLAVILLIIYAYSNAMNSIPAKTFLLRTVFLPLVLATFLSIHVDFMIAKIASRFR